MGGAEARPVIGDVGIDCSDVATLARFWCALLGYEPKYPVEDSWALLRHPRGRGPRIFLQRVPEPKVVKNRVHLDLCVVDAEAWAVRVESLGGRRLRRHEDEGVWIVMADPEGNEFCLVEGDPAEPWA